MTKYSYLLHRLQQANKVCYHALNQRLFHPEQPLIILKHQAPVNINSYISRKETTISNDLIPALRSGNQDAFRKLVAAYQQRVFNTAVSLLQDQNIAEDISQEVFITVFKSILSFNEKSSLSTWIYRITVNKCLDHLRAKKRQKRQGMFSRIFNTEDDLPEPRVFDHPGILLERKEDARYLFEAIETLPGKQKTVFILTQVEELSQKEIAEIMNLSIKAIESLLQRAKANLRKKLSTTYDRRNKQ